MPGPYAVAGPDGAPVGELKMGELPDSGMGEAVLVVGAAPICDGLASGPAAPTGEDDDP